MKATKYILTALAAAGLYVGPAHATLIEFDLSTFTGDAATIHVTLDDTANAGFITVTAGVVQPPIGDLRGLFFNLINNPGLVVGDISGADITDIAFNTSNTGGGNNVNPAGPFDFGLEFGTSGIGSDDIQFTSFTINRKGLLQLTDFGDFAGRLTSVGTVGGPRSGSSKLSGTPPSPPPTQVPEPATLLLLAIGLAGLALSSWRRKPLAC